MRILYVAKHNSGDNDDEGAIAFALKKLGHEVICVHEQQKQRNISFRNISQLDKLKADFCLFHKWPNVDEIRNLKTPKCFWYFDLVTSDDPPLVERSKTRVQWFNSVIQNVESAFCTDGDWVLSQQATKYAGKYFWLMQGADERVTGPGQQDPNVKQPPLLFTGMINHGSKRVTQITKLKERWGEQLSIIGEGGPRNRIHGRVLANAIANTKICIAPIGPSTDKYWSNRVFQFLGFGAFLIHPRCSELDNFYTPGLDYLYYTDDGGDYPIEEVIQQFIVDGAREDREKIADRGHRTTVASNLYRHRCEVLVNHMRGILKC
jgi:spore maturation protein CgeB